ncbi:MAG: type IVB secretion system protein IcmH/DotU [Polyangiaceae bacterium]
MDPMYMASAELLIVASQLGTAPATPPPDKLREELLRQLRKMVATCRGAGIADTDIAEARYALVAFIDDKILKSSWPGRTEWMKSPLQLQLFGEYGAGENFFLRMRAIQQRDRRAPALGVFHLCLALGFTGALQGSDSAQAQAYLASTREALPRLEPGAGLSPHGLPPDRHEASGPRRSVIRALAAGTAVVVIFGLVLLGVLLGGAIDRARDGLAALPGAGAAR